MLCTYQVMKLEYFSAYRCRDTFKLFPDHYHRASKLDATAGTLEQCIERCLSMSLSKCAAINYNKAGVKTNRSVSKASLYPHCISPQ